MNTYAKCSVIALFVGSLLSACSEQAEQTSHVMAESNKPIAQRVSDRELLEKGENLYKRHCAVCHGQFADGDPGWRQRDAEGFFPAPPLDGSGHAWHHSTDWLRQMILHGSAPGQGKMPAWNTQLTERDADAIIFWFQSLWPEKVYATWYEMQQR